MNASIENFVGIYENAFSPEFCQKVIGQFNQMTDLGFTQTRQELKFGDKLDMDDTAIWSGQLYQNEAAVSGLGSTIGKEFTEVFWNQCYPHYAGYFDVLNTSGNHAIYGNKVQRTNIGQGYHIWHYESGNRETSNRLLTHIVYLNDVEEGGETEMLYFHKRFKPKAGTMLIFPAAFTHTHRGNPPLSNDKYIITGWTEF